MKQSYHKPIAAIENGRAVIEPVWIDFLEVHDDNKKEIYAVLTSSGSRLNLNAAMIEFPHASFVKERRKKIKDINLCETVIKLPVLH